MEPALLPPTPGTSKRPTSLRNQLVFWFFLLSMVPLLLVSWVGYQQASQSLIEAAKRNLVTTATEKKRFLKNWFDYRNSDLSQLAADTHTSDLLLELQDAYAESQLPLNEFIKSYRWAQLVHKHKSGLTQPFIGYDYFYDFFLIDVEGNILFTMVEEPDLGTNLLTGPYALTRFAKAVQQTLETGEKYFSDFEHYAPSNDELAGFISAPVLDDSGNRIGVFAIQINVDRITKLLENNPEDYQSHYLIGEDQVLRTAPGPNTEEVLNRRIRTRITENLEEVGKTPSPPTILEYSGPNGNRVFGLIDKVKIWNVHWYLISEADQSRALASATFLGHFFALLCLLLLGATLALALVIARTITRPLVLLTHISESVARGQTRQSINIHSNNEIGRLAQAFNNMLISRHRFEMSLEERNKEIKKTLAALADQRFALDQHAIVATTDLKGNITYANSRFEEISGYDRGELLGKNHRILNSGVHPKAYFTEMYRIIGKGQVWHGEFCNKRKDGKLYWVDSTVVPFMGEGNKPISYIAIRTDITERKKSEMVLIRAKQDAEAAVKAKSEFLASMSHEIRTPMNGVLGMLNLLGKTTLSAIQERYTHLATKSAESLLVLINDILDFSKVDAGKLDIETLDFDLPMLLSDLTESMAIKAQEKKIELMLDIHQVNTTMVRGDPGRLRQILTNLVNNAIKFTESGEVVISAQLIEQADYLRLNCTVKDTGIGIPENKLEAIFELFSQVDASTTRRFGGTGLGLAIVKKLCQLMNGDVSVESEEGKGSRFHFHIRLSRSHKAPNKIPDFDIRVARILVVDDSHTNCDILRGQIEQWGAEVQVCNRSRGALDKLLAPVEAHQRPFDVAILDYGIPDMDGAELGRLIRQEPRLADLKLIMMTSFAERGDARFFADIGFNAYFPKPVTPSDLLGALTILMEKGEALSMAQPLVTSHYVRSLREPQAQTEAAISWPETLRILLVEDNAVNQVVAQGVLEVLGLSCDTVENGKLAIEQLKRAYEGGTPYSLILMDCQMPVMDGYQATRQTRDGAAGKAMKGIKIIAMTANAMEGDREKCLASGMDDYLTKPIEADALKNMLIQHTRDMFPDVMMTTATPEPPLDPEPTTLGEGKTSSPPLAVWNKENLLRRIGQRETLMKQLLNSFQAEHQLRLEEFAHALQHHDKERVRKLCHSLKGMAGNLGAESLQALAERTEQTLKLDAELPPTLMKDLTEEINALLKAFDSAR